MKITTKNRIKAISTMTFVALSFFASSQDSENLVANPSFESTDKKVKRLGSIANATGWTSPTGVRADLFVSSNIPDLSVPKNIYGSEVAKDGVNYAGIVAYSYGDKVPRSYIMSKMDAPMKKGMTYCVKFNVSLSEASKYASNNIGALFLKKPKGTDAKLPIIDEPSVVHFNNNMKIMNARYNWTEVCGTFVSTGGEKYIMLGNFLSDDETKYERMKKSKDVKVKELIAAYYYIDDVSVQLLDSDKGERCECAAEAAGDSYSTTIYQKVFQMTEEMTVSDQIEEHQVFFAFGRDKMNSEGKGSLDFIIKQLKANPEMKLQINAHNNAMEDEVGMENDFYADMDGKRLGSVMEYLIAGGIDKGRLIPSQKGSDSPNPDVTEEDLVEDEDLALAKSRRVTFKVR
ncbi:MAG: outer membrane protein OmpA-like peptidoglycan-associated protein [Crocinitomicaceae bacterium]|jgi:outer membrane protein OmpA-like peptidoglycan-associated protein